MIKMSDETTFSLIGKRLVYESSTVERWELDVDEIAAIGEYTLAVWPGQDDYFEVFVTRNGIWHSVPVGIGAWIEVHSRIEHWLGGSIEPILTRSTRWAHVILWPGELTGRPLFEDTRHKQLELSAELRAYLDHLRA